MAEMIIMLRRDPQTGKQTIIIKLNSDPDPLSLTLPSGVVPAEASLQPVAAGVNAEGRPWVDTPARPPKTVLTKLAKMGVASPDRRPSDGEELPNWLQALPLSREEKPP